MKVKSFIVNKVQERFDEYDVTLIRTKIDKNWCDVEVGKKLKESEKAVQYEVAVANKDGEKKTFNSWFPKSCVVEEAPDTEDEEIPFN